MSGPPLSPQRRLQIEALFEAVLDLAPEERSAYLASVCAGDMELQAEVAALLGAHELPAGILESDPHRFVSLEPVVLSPGDRVGRYQVVREIGKGGMATVYLVEEDRDDRPLALKVLHPGLGALFGHERFKREIRLAARLHHPHILRLHDSGETDGQLWYAMPFVEGGSLRERLRREGTLSVGDAVRIARQVADALDYAHRQGVIHRDVKPENLLLTRDGEVLVADFGIGRVFDASVPEATLTRSGMLIGTPAYMSPEQAVALRKLDGRTDIYSLGCVLYELLSGSPPYSGRTAQRAIAGHLNDPVPEVRRVRPEVPPAVDAALRRALAKTPEERYDTASRFADALVLGGTGTTRPARTAVLALMGLAVVAGAYLLRREPAGSVPAETGGRAEVSLAVLPLTNLSGEPEDEYFASGMAGELTGALAGVPGLRVAARTSTFVLRDRRDLDAKALARRLKVGHLVEGTLRRRGDSLRATIALVDAASGFTLWTEAYDRSTAEIFDLQDEIARRVTGSFNPKLPAPAPVARSRSPPAHDEYLRGRHALSGHGEADLRRAVDRFERAIAADSSYAPAWSGLAAAWLLLADHHAPPREAYPRAKVAALRAIGLDSTRAEGHAALGGVQLWYEKDFAAAERELEQALAFDPNAAPAVFHLAHLMAAHGRLDSALVLAQRAALLDPLSGSMADLVAFVHEARGKAERAVAVCDPERFVGSARDLVMQCRARALLAEGRPVESLRMLEGDQGGRAEPEERTRFGAYQSLGRHDDARRVLSRLEQRAATRYVRPEILAQMHAALGDREAAFRWLDRAYQVGAGGIVFLTTSSWWNPIRGDPRFEEMVERLRRGDAPARPVDSASQPSLRPE